MSVSVSVIEPSLSVHRHQRTQTFAALRSVVGIPTRAVATCHGSRRVYASAFAVAAAVSARALVHV